MNDANATDDESKVKNLSTTKEIQEAKWKEVSIVSENEAAAGDQSKVKK